MKKAGKEDKILISPTAIYYPDSILNKSQKEEMIKKGVEIKTRSGEKAFFLPAFRIQNKEGKTALALKLKEETKPALLIYYILDEEYVKKRKLIEGFKQLAKQNHWEMVDARDCLEATTQFE